ncbi:MAG TPA: rRNA maturation RNase YbeY [Bacteroidia bacterium]|nr:rRNA maturation RNase YbeY [Bacteroidia bacterium]HRS57686.1 rRNA maturation RNase YbeY [Bacteroidia bacterium]HRU67099.1 rRNA maturation RNase YbeY [Bacteroidia bacterium]
MISFCKDIENELSEKEIKIIKNYIKETFRKEKKKIKELKYHCLKEKEIKMINYELLKHNYVTDIITIKLNNEDKIVEAEAYICLEKIKKNAKNENTEFKNELKRIIFHGCLHLLGYDDKETEEIKIMRKREDELIKNVSRETKVLK